MRLVGYLKRNKVLQGLILGPSCIPEKKVGVNQKSVNKNFPITIRLK